MKRSAGEAAKARFVAALEAIGGEVQRKKISPRVVAEVVKSARKK